jgi:hypothetical protein
MGGADLRGDGAQPVLGVIGDAGLALGCDVAFGGLVKVARFDLVDVVRYEL